MHPIDRPDPHRFTRTLAASAARLERTSARLATGRRIATAADDPAGLAIAERLAAESRSRAQGERNLADGTGLVRTAEGALQSSHDALSRMRELTVQAANGTFSAADRATMQQEYDQIAAQLDQTAAGTSFGGRTLLDGSASGSGAPIITDGASGSTTVDLPDMRAAALQVAGRSVSDPATVGALDAAAAQIAGVRGRLGSMEQQFERAAEVSATARANAEAARSRIADADFAQEVATLTRDRILQQLQLAGVRVASRQGAHQLDLLG